MSSSANSKIFEKWWKRLENMKYFMVFNMLMYIMINKSESESSKLMYSNDYVYCIVYSNSNCNSNIGNGLHYGAVVSWPWEFGASFVGLKWETTRCHLLCFSFIQLPASKSFVSEGFLVPFFTNYTTFCLLGPMKLYGSLVGTCLCPSFPMQGQPSTRNSWPGHFTTHWGWIHRIHHLKAFSLPLVCEGLRINWISAWQNDVNCPNDTQLQSLLLCLRFLKLRQRSSEALHSAHGSALQGTKIWFPNLWMDLYRIDYLRVHLSLHGSEQQLQASFVRLVSSTSKNTNGV